MFCIFASRDLLFLSRNTRTTLFTCLAIRLHIFKALFQDVNKPITGCFLHWSSMSASTITPSKAASEEKWDRSEKGGATETSSKVFPFTLVHVKLLKLLADICKHCR